METIVLTLAGILSLLTLIYLVLGLLGDFDGED
jgi:hypothetical protein